MMRMYEVLELFNVLGIADEAYPKLRDAVIKGAITVDWEQRLFIQAKPGWNANAKIVPNVG